MKRILCRISALTLCLALISTSASALSTQQALELLEEDFLWDIPAQAYEVQDLDELLALLGDPYTSYMDAKEYQDFLSGVESTTSAVGIGVYVRMLEEGILVDRVVSGGPAALAGLQAGDLITAVDGVSCVPALDSHLSLLSGPQGTAVVLTVLRDGTSHTLRIIRQAVYLPNTQFSLLDDDIGYISCISFGSDTGTLMSDGLSQYDSQAEVWLLDLRDNPGGYTQSALDSIAAFSGPGYYLYLRDKTGQSSPYASPHSASSEDPVVMLVNGSTASSAEILAAGLRDQGRGILVGTRTYGKGVAQLVRDEGTDPSYFSGDALKITFAGFYSQLGNSTDQIGVLPTLLLDGPEAEAVAIALCGSPGELVTDGWLMLQIAQQAFFINPQQTDGRVLSALFSALPPSAQLSIGRDTYYWEDISVEDAAVLLEVDYANRYFSDVADSPYAQEINTLGTYDLLRGVGGGKFLPDGQLTRAEGCAMFAQLLNLSYDGPSRFSDVADSAWYADEVNAMAALGLVNGVGGGRFQPNSTLTQQEFLTILARIARMLNFHVDDYARLLSSDKELSLSLTASLSAFAPWARESVAVLNWAPQAVLNKHNSTMLHCDLEELSPTAPILREEAAACIYQMLSVTGILTV